jgi:mannan endo-1,4-beta-mannosidase
LDYTGKPFLIRGINNLHAYYADRAYQALDAIKSMGFNTVRVIWCADNLTRGGRCDDKDIHPLAELQRILEALRSRGLVAILALQNATGSDDPEHLRALVEWYGREDVKTLLNAYQDMLIINVANEWFASWGDPEQVYLKTYQQEILRMRAMGLRHVLMIDAAGWGQQVSSIATHYKDLLATDPNLLFSAHMYEVFASPEKVGGDFNTAGDGGIPFVVGEFACNHRAGQAVACEEIMGQSSPSNHAVGYLGWSYSGNSEDLSQLDVTKSDDWQTVTPWGATLLDDPHGIRATARPACFFPDSGC